MQLSNDFDLSLILVYIDLTFGRFEILTQNLKLKSAAGWKIFDKNGMLR